MELASLCSREAVAQITSEADSLALSVLRTPNATDTPGYFLSRMHAYHLPRVTACYESGALVGVVYAEERSLLGIRTGFVLGGDEMGRGLVLAAPEREPEVVSAACDHLLANGVHAIRFSWRSAGRESLPALGFRTRGIKVYCRTQVRPEGDWLELAADYPSFLARLGPHTRRNLRYYRKRAAGLGFTFAPSLSGHEYETAIHTLNQVADYPTERARQQRDRRFFEHFSEHVRVGLRGPDGVLVSVLGGVVSGKHFHVLTQLNDQNLRKLSISVVLRAFLLEELIRLGFTSVHFVNGLSPMLGRACDPVLLRNLYIDDTRSLFHPPKQLLAAIAEELKRRNRWVPVRLLELIGSYIAP